MAWSIFSDSAKVARNHAVDLCFKKTALPQKKRPMRAGEMLQSARDALEERLAFNRDLLKEEGSEGCPEGLKIAGVQARIRFLQQFQDLIDENALLNSVQQRYVGNALTQIMKDGTFTTLHGYGYYGELVEQVEVPQRALVIANYINSARRRV